MTSLFLNNKTKTGGQYSKVLKIILNGTLMSYTPADFDGALLSSMLTLNWN